MVVVVVQAAVEGMETGQPARRPASSERTPRPRHQGARAHRQLWETNLAVSAAPPSDS